MTIKLFLPFLLLIALVGCVSQPPTGDAVFVPDSAIKVEETSEETTEEDSEEATEETPQVENQDAQDIIDSLMQRIESNEEESVDEEETQEEAQEEEVAEEETEEVADDESFSTDETEDTSDDQSSEGSIVDDIVESLTQEEPTVLIVEENDFVSLVPQAEDPDGDQLTFTFTSPVDANGEWQTTYGDQGEYTVTVTASDGELSSSKEVLLIINKKEEPPTIDSFQPQESALTIEETETVEFSATASDLNSDPLTFEWKLDGVTVGQESVYSYETSYDDEGSHTIKLDVGDGATITSNLWSVEITNKNRLPVLQDLEDLTVQETDLVEIVADAIDEDGDTLSFSIDDDRFVQENEEFVWETDYDSEGIYTITITASDGQDTVSKDATITVENVNRKPVILDIVAK